MKKTNWFQLSISKEAAVEDFMRGVADYNVESYLSLKKEFHSLPSETQQKIKRYGYNSSIFYGTLLFFKFKNNIDYYATNLSWAIKDNLFKDPRYKMLVKKYFKREVGSPDSEALYIWKLLKKYDHIYHIPENLPDIVYKNFINDKQLNTVERVHDIFVGDKNLREEGQDNYPDSFLNKLKKQYPDLSEAIFTDLSDERRIELFQQHIQDYADNGNSTLMINAIISSGFNAKATVDTQKIRNSQIRRFNASLLPSMYDWANFRGENQLGMSNIYYSRKIPKNNSTISNDFQDILSQHKSANKNNSNVFYQNGSFKYYRFVSEHIVKELFLFGEVGFKLADFKKICNYAMSLEDAIIDDTFYDLPATIQTKLERSGCIFSEGNIFVYSQNDPSNYKWFKGSKERIESKNLVDIEKFNSANPVEKSEAFSSWFYNSIKNARIKETNGETNALDNFYINLFNNSIFLQYLYDANLFYNRVYKNGWSIIDSRTYDENYKYDQHAIVNSYNITMLELCKNIPEKYLDSLIDSEKYTSFVLCSGLFSGEKVEQLAYKDPTDSSKLIDYIRCRGDVNGTSKFVKSIQKNVLDKVKYSKDQFKGNIKDFLQNSGGAIKVNLSSFPELDQYVHEYIDKNLRNKNSENQYKLMLDRLNSLDIYIIDPSKMIDYFGNDTLSNFGCHPLVTSGMFFEKYSLLDNPTIFVFSGKSNDTDINSIVSNFLGISSESHMIDFETENTLWHEMGHFLNGVVGHEDVAIYNTVGGWMTDTDELIAMQQGNLQHLKRRLYTYLNSKYPFDGQLTAGLTEQIKSEIIESFPIEFGKMNRTEALNMVGGMLQDYEASIFEKKDTISREQQVANLSNMFASFLLSLKLELIAGERIKKELGQDIIEFPQEKREPEPHIPFKLQHAKDDIISKLETRPDYQKFLTDLDTIMNDDDNKNRYNEYRTNFGYRMNIATIDDLIMFLFNPPWTLDKVNVKNRNAIFYSIIPNSLFQDVANIVEREKIRRTPQPVNRQMPQVTPAEAKELGEFLGKMTENWWQVANNNWYKKIFADMPIHIPKSKWFSKIITAESQQIPIVSIPEEYIDTIKDIVYKCDQVGLVPYAVGGFVRDMIIGKRKPKDLDIMVDVDDQNKYFKHINPIIDNIYKNPINFIQSVMVGDKDDKAIYDETKDKSKEDKDGKKPKKQIIKIKQFNVEQSKNRKEFFRVFAVIDYIDNSTKVPKEINNFEFETSINPSLLLASQFNKQIPRGAAFGIYAVPTNIGEVEIAYPRTEQYIEEGSRKPRTEMGTIEMDALRRDFGMNSLFLNLKKYVSGDIANALQDITGHGIQDIAEQTIKISDPTSMDTIFEADPLRILRALRQSGEHGLTIDDSIIQYMKQNPHLIGIQGDQKNNWQHPYMPKLSAERVAEEFRKIMALPTAPQILQIMKDTGLLNYIIQLPQQAHENWEMDHLNPHHYENIWDHTITVMNNLNQIMNEHNVSKDKRRTLNFASFLHDIGKLFENTGYQNREDNRRTYVGHPKVSTEETKRICNRLKFSINDTEDIANLVSLHDTVLSLDAKTPKQLESKLGQLMLQIKGNLKHRCKDQIFDLLMLGIADRRSHKEGSNDDDYLQKAYSYLEENNGENFDKIEKRTTPYIDGDEIAALLKLNKGSRILIGVLNKFLVQAQIEQKIINQQEEANFLNKLAMACSILKKPAGLWLMTVAFILLNFEIPVDEKEIKRILLSQYKNVKDEKGQSVIIPLLNGNEIIEIAKEFNPMITAGSWVGKIANQLLESQVEGKIINKEDATNFVRQQLINEGGGGLITAFRVMAKEIKVPRVRRTKPRQNPWNKNDPFDGNGPGGKDKVKDQNGQKSTPRTISLEPNQSLLDSVSHEPLSAYYQIKAQKNVVAQMPFGDTSPPAMSGNQISPQKQKTDAKYKDYIFKFDIDLDAGKDKDKDKHNRMMYFYKNEKTGNYMIRVYDKPHKPIWLGDIKTVIQFLNNNTKYDINLTGYEDIIKGKMPMIRE